MLKIEPELCFCPVLLSYLVVFQVGHVEQIEASHYNNLKKKKRYELNINGELE